MNGEIDLCISRQGCPNFQHASFQKDFAIGLQLFKKRKGLSSGGVKQVYHQYYSVDESKKKKGGIPYYSSSTISFSALRYSMKSCLVQDFFSSIHKQTWSFTLVSNCHACRERCASLGNFFKETSSPSFAMILPFFFRKVSLKNLPTGEDCFPKTQLPNISPITSCCVTSRIMFW